MDEKLNMFVDAPVFAGFLFDASGSMKGHQADVIDGHKQMLDTLRRSAKCAKGVLYVYQSTFADKVTLLQPFYPMDRNGKDNVVALSTSNYRPSGQTALYAAIIAVVNELETQMTYALNRGFYGSARIAVITDGHENASTPITNKDVQEAVGRLRDKEWLESSVVVGLLNPYFNETMLENLRQAIGFAQSIKLDRTDKEIRKAFVLASEPRPDR